MRRSPDAQKRPRRIPECTKKAAVWCVPALRVPLVHSLINHFRKARLFAVAGSQNAPAQYNNTDNITDK